MSWLRSLGFVVVFVTGTAKAEAPPQAPGDQLVITSDSNCPSAEAVRQTLGGLLPVDEWPSFSVKIRSASRMLEVAIGSQNTPPRQIEIGPDCVARATAVALMISTWTGDLPVEAAGTPILAPPAPPPALPEPAIAPPPVQQPEVPRHRQNEIGAGLLVSSVGGVVPGGRVEWARMRPENGLGWRIDASVPAARESQVGGGKTRWMRYCAGVALAARWTKGSLSLDGDFAAMAALTYAWGKGYAVSQSDWSPTWGLAAGLRAGLPLGLIRLWLDVRAITWLREQNVRISPQTTGATTTLDLPTWDAQAAVGLSILFQ
jgi:hypothetical protein